LPESRAILKVKVPDLKNDDASKAAALTVVDAAIAAQEEIKEELDLLDSKVRSDPDTG